MMSAKCKGAAPKSRRNAEIADRPESRVLKMTKH
jgi:hypothetical protein